MQDQTSIGEFCNDDFCVFPCDGPKPFRRPAQIGSRDRQRQRPDAPLGQQHGQTVWHHLRLSFSPTGVWTFMRGSECCRHFIGASGLLFCPPSLLLLSGRQSLLFWSPSSSCFSQLDEEGGLGAHSRLHCEDVASRAEWARAVLAVPGSCPRRPRTRPPLHGQVRSLHEGNRGVKT